MRQEDINNLTEDPIGIYSTALDKCKSKQELLNMVKEDWPELAAGCIEQIEEMPDDDFKSFREGLDKERKSIFSGEEWSKKYGYILTPDPMFKATLLSSRCKAPWGMCFLRLMDQLAAEV